MGKFLSCAKIGAAKVLHFPRRPAADLVEDPDAALLALDQVFSALLAEHDRLHIEAERTGAWPTVEYMVERMAPVGDAIMAMPAHTVAGLAVKARVTKWANDTLWDKPLRDLDHPGQMTRQLVEAVLALAEGCR